MDAEDAPYEVARRVVDMFESRAVPYAIGGALAFCFYGPPRATTDVDLNVFLDLHHADAGLDALRDSGLAFDRDEAVRAIAVGGEVRAYDGRTRVDVFFDSIPLHRSAAQRTRVLPFVGRPARVLSPEDLCVLKLMFHRGKDLVDIERMVATNPGRLDLAYVRRWIVDMMGEDDPRTTDWDGIVRDLA